MPSSSNMESFLVYLFIFYYAISELEQNKQNNTIIFFLLFIFLTKKWTSAVCGGVRAHPSHPPSLRACSRITNFYLSTNTFFSNSVGLIIPDQTKLTKKHHPIIIHYITMSRGALILCLVRVLSYFPHSQVGA